MLHRQAVKAQWCSLLASPACLAVWERTVWSSLQAKPANTCSVQVSLQVGAASRSSRPSMHCSVSMQPRPRPARTDETATTGRRLPLAERALALGAARVAWRARGAAGAVAWRRGRAGPRDSVGGREGGAGGAGCTSKWVQGKGITPVPAQAATQACRVFMRGWHEPIAGAPSGVQGVPVGSVQLDPAHVAASGPAST